MKTIFLFFLLLTLSLAACNKEEASKPFLLESKFKIDQVFHVTDNPLQFTLAEINDSRCPSDVVCVWEGQAEVKIVVDSPVQGTIVLNTFDHETDTLGAYAFQLVGVSPYPISTKTIALNEYEVTLKVEKL